MRQVTRLGDSVIPHKGYTPYRTDSASKRLSISDIPVCTNGDITTAHTKNDGSDKHSDVLINSSSRVTVSGRGVVRSQDLTDRGGICTAGGRCVVS